MIRTSSPARPAAPEAQGMPRLLGLFSLAALVAFSLAARPASAGQMITSQSVYNGNNVTVNGTYNNNNGVSFSTGSVRAGSFETTFFDSGAQAIASFLTYCIDLATNNNAGLKVDALVSFTDSSGPVDAEGAARNLGAAGWVFVNYANMSAGQLNSTFGSNVNAAQADAAIQVAIWLAAYGTENLSFTGNAKAINLAKAIVAEANGRTAEIGFIDYPPILNGPQTPTNQDMVFLPTEASLSAVPEPSTLAMAAFGGVIGLGMMGRKRLMARKAKAKS